MEDKNKRSGPGFLSLLTLLFIGLRLTNYIQWSWFWVLSPTLIPIMLALIIAFSIAFYGEL